MKRTKTKPKAIVVLLFRLIYSLSYIRNSTKNHIMIGTNWILDVTIGRLLYSIPFVRRRARKTMGVDTFEAYIKKNSIMSTKAVMEMFPDEYKGYFAYAFSMLLFFLPIDIVIHSSILFSKCAWLFVYRRSEFITDCFLIVSLLLSVILGEKFFWRKDRYLKYFTAFEKENSSPIIIWATGIGTLMLIVLLIIADFAIRGYADTLYDIHHK